MKRKIRIQLVRVADSVIRESIDSIKGKISKQEVISEAQKAAKENFKESG